VPPGSSADLLTGGQPHGAPHSAAATRARPTYPGGRAHPTHPRKAQHMTTRIPRLKGEARTALADRAAGLYVDGSTIRSVAAQIGRSYSGTRALLVEAGVTLRPKGGSTKATT
jgi:hypothetical protein